MTEFEGIEESLGVLRGEIQRLDSMGLKLAASLVRIAEVELQMRLYNVSREEIDVLCYAASAAEKHRALEDSEEQ